MLLAAVLPRMRSPEELRATADEPRPVTRRRRLLAMVIDGWWAALAGGVAATTVVAGVLADQALNHRPHDPTLVGQWVTWSVAAVWALMGAVAVSGRFGVSPGLGTAHLAYVDAGGTPAGWRRSTVVWSCLVLGVLGQVPVVGVAAPWAALWLLVELLSCLVHPRGITAVLVGLHLVDARNPSLPLTRRRLPPLQ